MKTSVESFPIDDEIFHYIHPVPFLEKDPLNGSDMETMLNRLLRDFWE